MILSFLQSRVRSSPDIPFYIMQFPRPSQVSFSSDDPFSGIPLSPRRPSDHWLRHPSYIGNFCLFQLLPVAEFHPDGCLDPPHFYLSNDEIEHTCRAYGHMAQPSVQPAAMVTAAPVPPVEMLIPTVPLTVPGKFF